MALGLPKPHPLTRPAPADVPNRKRLLSVTAACVLADWLVLQLPAFLCMGLDCDISMYDLCARRVLAGDTHYHDLFETNFPGIVWLHMAVRSVLGWRSEVLRAVDLAVVAAVVGLLLSWLPRS